MPLSLEKVNLYRSDALYQSNWRYTTAQCLDYVDGNQFPSDLAAKMQAKGLPLTTVNICKGVVETACGIVERLQTDAIVLPEDDDEQDVADVLSYKMKQAERETKADRCCLDAARIMFGGGIGWVEVARQSDPFLFPYRVNPVPYTEMWTDPRSIRVDYSDSEYLRRLRFFEKGAVTAIFPQAQYLTAGADLNYAWYEPQLYQRDNYTRDISNVALDLWGANRDLVPLEEIQYREKTMQYVFKVPNGQNKWILFDERNPMHMEAYQAGLINVEVRPVSKSRQAFYLGQTCLLDRPNPAGGNRFTYVPFVFEREARTGSPYSAAIRAIMSLQDEVNTRRAKAVYALLSTRVVATADAVDDLEALREEISRRDAMIILGKAYNPNVSQFNVEDGIQFAGEQMKMFEGTMEIVPQIAGVPLSLQGIRDGSVDSGVGIDKLADMGINSLSRVFSHFREARRSVFEIMLQYIIEDVGSELTQITGTDRHGKRLQVPVNVPMQDESGQTFKDNDLTAMELKVVLDDVPHSATHRQEQLKVFMASLSAAPPDIQAVAIPYVADLLDIPPQIKKDLVAALKQKMGIAATPEEQQAKQDAMQHQMNTQEQAHQMGLAAAAAKISKDQAAAEKDRALAAKAVVDAGLSGAQIHQTLNEAAGMVPQPNPGMPA